MGNIPNPENHIYLTLDSRLPIDKDVKDKEYSDYLRDSAYIFKDGEDEFVDLFYAKVGVNGNKWGLDFDGFNALTEQGEGHKLVIDPNKEIHKANNDGTGSYTTDYILNKQDDYLGGYITRIKKYDLDKDGRFDYARAIVKLDKNPNPKDGLTGVQRFKNALAAGLNETSPTVEAIDPTERWDALRKVKLLNITMVKNGAYKEYSKIQGLCKGSPTSCSNALAASLPEKSDGSLMQVLGSYTNMGNGNDNGTNANPDTPAAPATAQPFTQNIIVGQPQDTAKDVTKDENKPEQKEVSAEQTRIAELEKALKESVSENIANIRNELAPIELFENNEEKQKEAIKILGEDVEKLKYAKTVISKLVPLMIAYYDKNKSSTGKENKKDENPNPAVGTLPSFDNSPSNTSNSDVAQLSKILKTSNLNDLFKANLRLQRGSND